MMGWVEGSGGGWGCRSCRVVAVAEKELLRHPRCSIMIITFSSSSGQHDEDSSMAGLLFFLSMRLMRREE